MPVVLGAGPRAPAVEAPPVELRAARARGPGSAWPVGAVRWRAPVDDPERGPPRQVRVPRGTMIEVQGEPCRGPWLIACGIVAVAVTSSAGREGTLTLLGEGGVLGVEPLVPDSASAPGGLLRRVQGTDRRPARSHATAVAVTNCELIPVPLPAPPGVLTTLVGALAVRLADAERSLARLLTEDVETRTVETLRQVAGRFGTRVADGIRLDVTLTQGQLATMVGAARETTNRALTRLSERGRVQRRGGSFLIADRPEAAELRARREQSTREDGARD